jgi:hypothetical protein
MKLVDDAKSAWKWFSVQAMILAGALQLAWETLPPEWKASIPDSYVRWGTLAVLAIGVFGRLVKQDEK